MNLVTIKIKNLKIMEILVNSQRNHGKIILRIKVSLQSQYIIQVWTLDIKSIEFEKPKMFPST